MEKRGTKYLIRWKGMDEASDIWLSKSMTQRGSAIHLMMTEKDVEEETLRAVQAIDKATAMRARGGREAEGGQGRTRRRFGETKTDYGQCI